MTEPTNAPDVAQSAQAELEMLQHKSFSYFLHETNPDNGLVIDKTAADWPASIAATGFALAAYPVAVERGFMPRAAAVERTLTTLRFFWNSSQGPEPDATGHHGFYYHFLDMRTGRRAWQCELSTIDSAFLLAGALTAGAYFDADTPAEHEIRNLAETLYCRADWQWAQDGGATVTHGWKPESGFLKYRWEGYDEAMLLYILGLASPTHPLPENSYAAWPSTYRWEHCYGYEYLYAGSLFTYQLSHIWIDFRGLQDAFMRGNGIDYFEHSRRATYVQQRYAMDNPLKFVGYGRHCRRERRPQHDQSERDRAPILRLRGTRRAVWARRRHHRAVGCGDIAAVRNGGGPERQEMERVRQLPGGAGGYAYRAPVPAIRPATDYTARVIPQHTGVCGPAGRRANPVAAMIRLRMENWYGN